MKKISMIVIAAATLLAPVAASAQSFSIGPGGVSVDDGYRQPRAYGYDRDRGYGEGRRYGYDAERGYGDERRLRREREYRRSQRERVYIEQD